MDKGKSYDVKKISFALFWFFTGIMFVVMLSTTVRNHSQQNIKDIEINIEGKNHFVTKPKVETLLQKHFGTNHLEIPYKDVNLFDLEWLLNTNHYIEEANFYIDMKDVMHINLVQKEPIIRIISDLNSRDYYLSTKGDKIPVSKDYTARVLVATGDILDNGSESGKIESDMLWDLYNLSQFILKNEILYALTEQIHVQNTGEIQIVPKVGDFNIKIGKVERLDKKLLNIMVLYQEGLPEIGWDTYKEFNFSYENHIISSTN